MCEVCIQQPTVQELSEWELPQEFAVWTTAYVNSLPDSSFAWIDSSGGRHLPYKDKSGKVDLPHVRNALARLNQVKGMPSSVQARVRAKLQRLLGRQDSMDDIDVLVQKYSIEEDGTIWVHAFPYRNYTHPEYGEISFTRDVAEEMKKNFADNVLERDVSWNFDHGKDSSKGNKASAWVQELDVRDDGLWVKASLTKTATQELKDGEWRYVSVERLPEWTHPSTGVTYKNVLWGGAFTNTPFAKGVAPINLSDFDLHHKEPEVANEPEEEEGDVVDKKELCQKLGLPEDSTDDAIFSRLQALSETEARANKPDEVKIQKLADTEPELYAEIMEARKDRQERQAEKFAEGVRSPDGKVLAVAHRETVRDAHVKLVRGEIGLQEFAEAMAEATSKGMVRMGEIGTSLNGDDVDKDMEDKAKTADEFAREAQKLSEKENIDFATALQRLSEEHPEKAKAYLEIQVPTFSAQGGDE